jgi:hypothetical protein
VAVHLDDRAGHRLAVRAAQGDDGRVRDGRVAGQGVLDRVGVDAGRQPALHPVDEEQVAAVETAQVSGADPAAPQGLGGAPGVVHVPGHDLRRAYPDLADLAGRDADRGRVAHLELHAGHGAAD